MKSMFSAGFAAIVSAHLLVGAGMTQRDREHVVAHLQMTETWLLDEVSPLSATQLNFRAAPERWTIAEVVQHLVIAEPTYWKLLQDGVKQAPQKLEKQATDADVLWYGIDRTRHEKTESSKDAKGQTIDVRQGLDSFRKLHDMMLDYARNTDDDLRAHAVPEWGVDAYQCLLEISTHTQRHILQIREVKADSRFPKQ
jgi:DinB superfamily